MSSFAISGVSCCLDLVSIFGIQKQASSATRVALVEVSLVFPDAWLVSPFWRHFGTMRFKSRNDQRPELSGVWYVWCLMMTTFWSYDSKIMPKRCQDHKMDKSLHPILDTRIFVLCPLFVTLRGNPPWILKRCGLESSGRRLISSIGKTKEVAFFFAPKIFREG